MLTAFGDPAAVRRGYDAGADDFLHKPSTRPSLILKVRAFLRLKSLHDDVARSREEAQARARDLARLQEIGRDWSLIAEPEEFSRMVTSRLAGLIGAPIVRHRPLRPGDPDDGGGASRLRPRRRGRPPLPLRGAPGVPRASGTRAPAGPT